MKGVFIIKKDKQITDELLSLVSGGNLPLGWKKIADSLYPQYKEIYPDATYEDACLMLQEYFSDPDDLAKITDYIQKYF